MTDDLKLKSVKELHTLAATHALGINDQRAAMAELASRASQLSALREALQWVDVEAMLEGEDVISYWLDDDDSINGTEVRRKKGESLPGFLLRAHSEFLASQTNTP